MEATFDPSNYILRYILLFPYVYIYVSVSEYFVCMGVLGGQKTADGRTEAGVRKVLRKKKAT